MAKREGRPKMIPVKTQIQKQLWTWIQPIDPRWSCEGNALFESQDDYYRVKHGILLKVNDWMYQITLIDIKPLLKRQIKTKRGMRRMLRAGILNKI